MSRSALTATIAFGLIAAGIATAIIAVIAVGLWSSIVILGLIRGQCSKCPRCRSNLIRRSWHRLAVEKSLPRFISTNRCDHCRKRFFACQSTDYTT